MEYVALVLASWDLNLMPLHGHRAFTRYMQNTVGITERPVLQIGDGH